MALDGTVIAALIHELSGTITGGRVTKIAMPEKDELLITVKKYTGGNERLLISAGASLPLMYLTDEQPASPAAAPAFCMLLRKHIGSAKIIGVEQIGLERIIEITFEHYNEMGDLCRKKLITELMGKYSNIIFTDEKGLILDSIRHVNASVSSLREVLPGKTYFLPEELKKKAFLAESAEGFEITLKESPLSVCTAIYKLYEGMSPVMAVELCERAGADPDVPFGNELTGTDVKSRLIRELIRHQTDILEKRFAPEMILKNGRPEEFSAVSMTGYENANPDYVKIKYDSISRLLKDFYSKRNAITRINQKTEGLKKIVSVALDRALRKLDIQEKQLKDCAGKEKFKIYGDLISTFGYSLKGGEKYLECSNYYDDNRLIRIPLDEQKDLSGNAKRYYDKYAKLRRTEEAVGEEMKRTSLTVAHLQSILTSIELAESENDLVQIRKELADYGYVKNNGPLSAKAQKNRRTTEKEHYLHFISSDGYDILVGKNNYQNDMLTFKIASNQDWWFHAKGIPGSHVILKNAALAEGADSHIPDRAFEEAASVAAYYSKNRESDKVEVDYVQKKQVKRVTGGAPGFVIYHTNYSMTVAPKVPENKVSG